MLGYHENLINYYIMPGDQKNVINYHIMLGDHKNPINYNVMLGDHKNVINYYIMLSDLLLFYALRSREISQLFKPGLGNFVLFNPFRDNNF